MKELEQGKWYWVTYEYRLYYYESNHYSNNKTSIELKKCIATKDNGINGLFKTNHLDAKWIDISHCQEYVGKTKHRFFCHLFGDKEQIPDVDFKL